MSEVKKIREKAKAMSMNKNIHREGHLIYVSDVEALLEGYEIHPKPEEWEESVGETLQKIGEEIDRKLKFHGIYESEDTIIIDKKQNKFVVIKKEQMQKPQPHEVPLKLDKDYVLISIVEAVLDEFFKENIAVNREQLQRKVTFLDKQRRKTLKSITEFYERLPSIKDAKLAMTEFQAQTNDLIDYIIQLESEFKKLFGVEGKKE